MKLQALTAAPGVTLFHTGPSLDLGPLPAIFYFALSGEDSLTLDPYNQPVQSLSGEMVRVFSMTLPAHEGGLSPHDALRVWAEDISKGRDFLAPFLDQIQIAVDFALREKFIDEKKMGLMGLSRGGLVASFVAARDPRFRFLLGFAPLTKLSLAKEFQEILEAPYVQFYDANTLAEQLADRHVRLYIGNRDTRVSTRDCFDFSMNLVNAAHEARIRPAQIELIMTRSIGQMGHGTSPETFAQGAAWLMECLTHG